jgi:hypothetical protein
MRTGSDCARSKVAAHAPATVLTALLLLVGVGAGTASARVATSPSRRLAETAALEPPSGFIGAQTTRSGATFAGSIRTETSLTECVFEWGITTAYEHSLPCSEEKPEKGALLVVAPPISGLAEATEYHLTLVAANAAGSTRFEDQYFETRPHLHGIVEYGLCERLTKLTTPKKGEGSGCPTNETTNEKVVGKEHWHPGPEGECFASKKGKYTDSSCLKLHVKKGEKGAFERRSCFGDEGGCGHYTSTAANVTLATPGLGYTLVCTTAARSGAITGARLGEDHTTLTGCAVGGSSCESVAPNGDPSGQTGTIAVNALDTRPVNNEGTALTEFLPAEHQPYWFEADCEGLLLRASGSPSAESRLRTEAPTTEGWTDFSENKGGAKDGPRSEQELLAEASDDGGATWTAASPSLLTALFIDTFAAPIQLAEVR